jgi:hypothetical protein
MGVSGIPKDFYLLQFVYAFGPTRHDTKGCLLAQFGCPSGKLTCTYACPIILGKWTVLSVEPWLLHALLYLFYPPPVCKTAGGIGMDGVRRRVRVRRRDL